MFLMTETITENISTSVVLDEATGKKELYIEGVFAQAELKNRNLRKYPLSILEREVDKYVNDFVNTKRALGELSHPDNAQINPDRVSHLITSLVKEGNNFIGKAKILDTPCGNVVRGIIEGGAVIGVSTRGTGSVKSVNGINEVQDDFGLYAVDVVTNPSAIDAFVEGIMEGAFWIPKQQEIIEDIKEAKSVNLAEAKAKAFMLAMKHLYK